MPLPGAPAVPRGLLGITADCSWRDEADQGDMRTGPERSPAADIVLENKTLRLAC